MTLISAGGRADAATAIDRPADPRFRFYTVVAGGGSVLLDEDTAALDQVRPGTAVTVADQTGAPGGSWSPGSPTWARPGGSSAARC